MENSNINNYKEIDVLQEAIDSQFTLTYNKFLTVYHQELLNGFHSFKHIIRLSKYGKIFDHVTFNDYSRHIYTHTDKRISRHKYLL